MATEKRAIRHLTRGVDGTMKVQYLDLDTGLEVFDLTGYNILDPGQGQSLSDTQKDNSGDKKVAINPSSGGSSGKKDKGSDRSGKGSNTYQSDSKNPAIRNYLNSFPAAPGAPATSQTTQPGQLQVDPNFDPNSELGGPPSQPTEGQVGTVNEYGQQVDIHGNTYIADPNNPSRITVMAPISKDFNPGLQEAVEDSARASGLYTKAQENIETGQAPGFVSTPVGMGRPEAPASGMPAAQTAPSISHSYARPEAPASGMPAAPADAPATSYGRPEGTAAGMPAARPGVSTPVGMGRPAGTPSGLPAAPSVSTPVGMGRPEAPASGLPGARPSVAKGVINGVRPEAPASGMPAAKGTPVGMGRPAGTPSGLPASKTQAFASAVSKATNPTNAVRPEAPASGLPGAKPASVPREAIDAGIHGFRQKAAKLDKLATVEKGIANYEAGLATRMQDNPAAPAPSLSEQVGRGVAATSPLGFDEASMAPGGVASTGAMPSMSPAPTSTPVGMGRPAGTPAGMPAAKPGVSTPVGMGRPAGTPAGMPAAKTAQTTQAPTLGGPGLNDIYSESKPSAAQATIDNAKDVTGQYSKASPTVGKPTTTTFDNVGGYSQTQRTGTAGWRNNNPGNLEASAFTRSQPGYIGAAGGVPAPGWSKAADGTMARMAAFDTVENGIAAQAALLGTSRYQGLTISQAVAKYAPAFENNPTAYAKAVADALGVPTNTPMSDLSASQRNAMVSAMHEVEGSLAPGRSTTSLTERGIAARDNYTGPGTGSDTPSERNAAGRSGMSSSFGAGGSRGVASNIGRNDAAGGGRGSSPGGVSSSFGQGGSRGNSGIGTNDRAGGGRGSSMGGPGIGGSAGAGPGRGSSPGSTGGPSSGAGPGRGSSPGGPGLGGSSGGGGYSSGNTSGTTSGHGLGIGRA